MAEELKDLVRMVLDTAINNSATSLDVDDGGALTNGAFTATFTITHPLTGEIELVRASNYNAGTNVLTVTRGQGTPATTAIAFPKGSIVEQVLDFESLDTYIAENASGGGGGGMSMVAWASLPPASTAGLAYVFSDSVYMAVDNGASYDYFLHGVPCRPPSLAGSWTNLNLGGTGVITNRGFITAFETASNAQQIRGQYIALPSAPYDLVVAFQSVQWSGLTLPGCGWYDIAGGRLTYVYMTTGSGPALHIQKWSSVSSVNSDYPGWGPRNGNYPNSPLWLRFVDDNTNRKLYLSADNGQSWALIFLIGRTDFHTPDAFFIGSTSFSTQIEVVSTLLSYDV
jgi:hypothetical protein